MKCPRCGAECADGAKFCEECGYAVPQQKKCPKCHTVLKPSAKFCVECGYSFLDSGTSSQRASGKTAIGDKNVIAGDVVGSQENFKISGAATFVKNEDETKKTVKCRLCGRSITILHSAECPKCGRIVCENCFDAEKKKCTACVQEEAAEQEKLYIQALRKALEDNKITMEERRELNALQKQLNLSSERAFELEKKIKKSIQEERDGTVLSDYIRHSLDAALELLYDKGDFQEAYNRLKPIYQRYPQNEEVITDFLFAAIKVNAEEAVQIIQQSHADILGFQLVCLDYELQIHDLNAVDERLTAAVSLWQDNLLLLCRKILCLIEMYDELKDGSFLQKASEILSSLGKPQNKLESSWLCKAQYTLSLALGDELPELTEEYCHVHGIYYALSQPEVTVQPRKFAETEEKAEEKTSRTASPSPTADLDWIQREYTRFLDLSPEQRAEVKSLLLPEGMGVIRKQNFAGCTSLKSITIPQGVATIGNEAFCRCSSLSSIRLPAALKSIGSKCFAFCENLGNVTIPDQVAEIGDGAFLFCGKLTEITIPAGVSEIPPECFAKCSALTKAILPDSVTKIGYCGFWQCGALVHITLPDHVTTIEKCAFQYCRSLESAVIPASVTEIGADSFGECDALQALLVPVGFDRDMLKKALGGKEVDIIEYDAAAAENCAAQDSCSEEGAAQPAILRDEVILPVIEEFFNHTGSFDGFYKAPRIPEAKEKHLRKTAGIPADTKIYALADTTTFGSAKNGAAFTSRGIYIHNGWTARDGESYGTWRDFIIGSSEPHIWGTDEVSIMWGLSLHCSGGPDKHRLRNLLLDLKKKLRSHIGLKA